MSGPGIHVQKMTKGKGVGESMEPAFFGERRLGEPHGEGVTGKLWYHETSWGRSPEFWAEI
jgi:hypothetical protein